MKLLLLLTALLCVPLSALAGNQPAWRSPRGTGVAEEKNVPTEWSAEKNVTWKVPLPGAGNSTPIVWEDKMFLTAALADGATGPRDRGTGSPGVALDTRGGGL